VQPIKAVVFDLDSTLCVSTQDDEVIHEAVFERVGCDPFFEPADLYAVEFDGLPDPDSEREHYEQLYAAAAEIAGTDPENTMVRDIADATVDVLDNEAVAFRQGAEAALAYAREEYDSVGLLTAGTEATQTEKLETLGIRDAFDAAVFCGPGTGVETKPHNEPFELVCTGLGVAPGRAVYVGDRHDGDVVGAHNAGMQSAWVPVDDAPRDLDPAPTYRLDSPSELSDAV